MRSPLAALFLGCSLVGCEEKSRSYWIDTEGQLEDLADKEVLDRTVSFNVNTREINLARLRGIGGGLVIEVTPSLERVHLPLLEGVNGTFRINGARDREQTLIIEAPLLRYLEEDIWIGGGEKMRIRFQSLAEADGARIYSADDVELVLPSLRSPLVSGLSVEHSSNVLVDAPHLSVASHIVIDGPALRLKLDRLQRVEERFSLGSGAGIEIHAPRLESIGWGYFEATKDSVLILPALPLQLYPYLLQGERARVDLRSAGFVDWEYFSPYDRVTLGVDLLADVGSIDGPIELHDSRVIVHATDLSGHLDVRGRGTITAPQLASIERASVSGEVVFDAPMLKHVGALSVSGASFNYSPIERARSLRIHRVESTELDLGELRSIESTDCAGGLEITANPELAQVHLPKLESISGDVWVQSNPKLGSCDVRRAISGAARIGPRCETVVLDNQEVCE